MKQKNCLSSVVFSGRLSFTSRSYNSRPPIHKKYYSPKQLTRRTQRKDIPSSAFLRRKQSYDKPEVYKYLSPRKMHQDEQWAFLSDENYGQKTERRLVRNSFELDFSRINAQKSEYTMAMSRSYEARNLFQDMRDEIGEQHKNVQMTERIKWVEGQEKHMPSFDTTSESFHHRESRKVEELFSVMVKENGRLIKEVESSSKQNTNLREQLQQVMAKKQQIQQQLAVNQQKFSTTKQELMLTISKLQQQHSDELIEFKQKIFIREEKLAERQKQAQTQHKLISNLYLRLQELESECHQRQIHTNTLDQKIEEMKGQIQDKNEYNACLEDVILQLNVKIDDLRKQNFQVTNDFDDKIDQLELLLLDYQRQSDILTMNEAQIITLKQQLSHLTASYESLEIQNKQPLAFTHQHSTPQSFSHSSQLINSLQDQINTLQSVLDIQRQHNEKLKKQISYNHVELTFLKKNQNQNQKHSKQFEILKERNKKLLKKVSQLMEENSTLKDQIQTLNKKTKNQGSIKKFLGPFLGDNLPKNNKQKARFASQRTNLHHPEGQASNHCLKKNSGHDSDDELSFQLSPERK